MNFAPVSEAQLDPIPQGFAAIDSSALDAQSPEASGQEYTPLETVGLRGTNVFGAGPVIGAVVNSLTRGGTYKEWLDKFKVAKQEASEQNPTAAKVGSGASIVAETILGGAFGKAVAGGSKLAGLSGRVLPWAEANPVMSHVLSGIGGGAAYGAASGAGEALTEEKDIGSEALKGAAGGALVGGALGGIFGGLSKVARGAVEREEGAIVKGALKGGEAKAVRDDVVSLLRKDPEIRSVIAKGVEEATPVLRGRMEAVLERKGMLLDALDGGKGISLGGTMKAIDKEINELAKTPLQEGSQKALEGLKESILKAWAPTEIREALLSKEAKESQALTNALMKKLDNFHVPSKKFSDLERSVEEAFEGQQKIAVQKAVGNALTKQIESASGKGATEKAAAEELSKLNRDYAALSAISESLGKASGVEPVHGMHKLMSIFTHHGPVGAAVALASGHPIPAAVLAAPALAKKGDKVLAYLQREAAVGNQKAIKILQAAEAAKSVGTAGSGAVGSAQSGMLSGEQQ